jgi:hypothetical protein
LSIGRNRRLDGLTNDVLDTFAFEALQHGGIVQVLAMFHDFHDFDLQAGGNGFFNIFERAHGRKLTDAGTWPL